MTESSRWRLVLFGLILIALPLRYIHVNRMSLWGDEACMVFLCAESPGNIIDALAATDRPDVDVAPPLYFLSLHAWMRLFGQSVTAIRGFSILFGVLTVLAAAILGKRMFSPRIGLLLGAFTAVHPFQIWYSQECRMYAMAAFLATVSIITLYDVSTKPQQSARWFAFCLAVLASMYTQYYGFLLAAAGWIYLLWRARSPETRRFFIRGAAGTALGWLIGYGPWWIVLYRDFTQANAPGGFPSFFHPFKTPAFLFIKMTLFGNEQFVLDHRVLYALMAGAAAVPLVWSLRYLKDERVRLALVTAGVPFLIVYLGSLAGMRIYKSHPFIIFQIPVLLLTAFGIERLPRWLSRFWVVMLLLSYGFVLNTLVLNGDYVKPRVHHIVEWIQPRYREGDLVAVLPAFLPNPMPIVGDLLVFRYYADDRFKTLYLTGKNADDVSSTILDRFRNHSKLFLVYQDNPQIHASVVNIKKRLAESLTPLETKRFTSRIRDFTMGVAVYKHRRNRAAPEPESP